MASSSNDKFMLLNQFDWDTFYTRIQNIAEGEGVWKFINPEVARPPTELKEPSPPKDTMAPVSTRGSTATAESTPQPTIFEENQKRLMDEQLFDIKMKRYKEQRKGLSKVLNEILILTGSTWRIHIERKTHPRDALIALKEAINPGRDKKDDRLESEFFQLHGGPGSKTVTSWLNRWRNLARHIEARTDENKFHMSNHKLVLDFLRGVATINSPWATPELAKHLNTPRDEQKKLSKVIENFRQYNDLVEPPRTTAKRTHSAMAAELGGESIEEDPQQDRKKSKKCCVCGYEHMWTECYYLNKDGKVRPDYWHIKADIVQKIKDQLSKDERYKAAVERILGHAYDKYLEVNRGGRGRASRSKTTAKSSANLAVTDEVDPEANFLQSNHDFEVNYNADQVTESSRDDFIIDSGANVHVTHDSWLYRSYAPSTSRQVVKHGNTESVIMGFGTIRLETRSGAAPTELLLHNVAHVPDFHINIISIYRLRMRGIYWDQDWLYSTAGRIARTPLSSRGLWILEHDARCLASSAFAAIRMTRTPISHDLWHKRLGHSGDRAIDHLQSSAEAIGKAISQKSYGTCLPTTCETCSLSKAKQQISRSPQRRGTEPLIKVKQQVSRSPQKRGTAPFNHVHMDIIFFPKAYNSHRYGIHYYCDYTHYHYLTTLASRKEDEMLKNMEYFIQIIQKQGFTIRRIRLDHESSLKTKFDSMMDKYGIIVEQSAPYSPQQNGSAERSGAMIIVKARCLLAESKLPEQLWPELALAAVYLLNRTPVEGLQWRTPYEAVFKIKPSISHLRIIGSKAYVLKPNIPKLAKLHARARIGYLIGYEASNIWRIWLPASGRVIPARDVTFDEARRWGGEREDPNVVKNIEINQELTTIARQALDLASLPNQTQIQQQGSNSASTASEDHQSNEQSDEGTRNRVEQASQDSQIPDQNPSPGSGPNNQSEAENAAGITQAASPEKGTIAAMLTPDMTPDRQLNPQQTFETDRTGIEDREPLTPISNPGEAESITLFGVFITATQDSSHRIDNIPSAPDGWRAMTQHPHARLFKAAAEEEIQKLTAKNTWKQVNVPQDKQVIPVRWVFTYKVNAQGVLIKHKARLCVRGDLQKLNPHEDVYAATATFKTFRTLMSLAAAFDLEVWQLDAVNAFVNADIDDDVYISLPEGYSQKGLCLKLLKALYGLKKSPLLWLNEFSKTLRDIGLVPVQGENCLFRHTTESIFVFFYVDDVLILGPKDKISLMTDIKEQLRRRYEMKDIGEIQWFLNVRITRDRAARKLWLTHDTYIDKIVQKFNLGHLRSPDMPGSPRIDYVKPSTQASPQLVKQYQERIGSLIYPSVTTRPDIAWISSKLSQYSQNPSPGLIQEADRVIAYLNGTKYLSIEYSAKATDSPGSQEDTLKHIFEAASDASFADDQETRHSSQGYCFKLFGGPIQWQASRQKTVTLSTTEAELLSLTHASKELQALDRLFIQLRLDIDQQTSINCDNQQTVGILNKELPRLSSKLRHVDIHQLWLRQEVDEGRVCVKWTPSQDMIADGFTKPLSKQKHQIFISQLGMTDMRYALTE
jgi:hypothetical protein